MDLADSASDEFDHDLALSQLSGEQDVLYEVEEAIRRILAGTYGTCEETGEAIPDARLRAIPWTRFSELVQRRLEKKGAVSRERVAPVASVRGPDVRSLEEVSETPGEEQEPDTPPKDEALWPVYSPPGKHLHPERPKRRSSSGEGETT
jgi:RNA polymerase-binding transcription factor DksA